MYKLDLEKEEEPEIKLPTCIESKKKQGNSKKIIYFCLIDYAKAFDSVQFSSVTQSCPTLHDPMENSMPGLPVHHQLPEFTQTHLH